MAEAQAVRIARVLERRTEVQLHIWCRSSPKRVRLGDRNGLDAEGALGEELCTISSWEAKRGSFKPRKNHSNNISSYFIVRLFSMVSMYREILSILLRSCRFRPLALEGIYA